MILIDKESQMRESRSERHKHSKGKSRLKTSSMMLPLAALLLVVVIALTIWAAGNGNTKTDAAELPTLSATPGNRVGTPTTPKPTGTPTVSSKPGTPTPSPSSTLTPTHIPTSNLTTTPNGNGATGGTGGTTKPDDDSRVKLSFVGDVIFASTVENVLREKGFDYPYTNVKSYLQNADLTIANMESPITSRGDEQKKEYVYRSPAEALKAFAETGFDLVNLANNHILDYGVGGLLDTFDNLDKAGIKHVGAGRNVSEAFQPVIIEKKGIKIAFLGFSKVVPTADWKAGKYKDGKDRPGVADTYALEMPIEAIKQAKSNADLVVVIAHWGAERNDMPESYQRDFAKKYVDAGADLIIGGHPHVLQGFEPYNGKWIAYSTGNFLFTTRADAPKTWDSGILQASCTKQGGCELKLVPVLTKWALPEIMQEPESIKLFERLSHISFGAIVDKDGAIRAGSNQTKTNP
jgi:poly-gamma-glutamate capsule biosynthesis protein CapA/YwtB (metallophosphatase superfamily)